MVQPGARGDARAARGTRERSRMAGRYLHRGEGLPLWRADRAQTPMEDRRGLEHTCHGSNESCSSFIKRWLDPSLKSLFPVRPHVPLVPREVQERQMTARWLASRWAASLQQSWPGPESNRRHADFQGIPPTERSRIKL